MPKSRWGWGRQGGYEGAVRASVSPGVLCAFSREFTTFLKDLVSLFK